MRCMFPGCIPVQISADSDPSTGTTRLQVPKDSGNYVSQGQHSLQGGVHRGYIGSLLGLLGFTEGAWTIAHVGAAVLLHFDIGAG